MILTIKIVDFCVHGFHFISGVFPNVFSLLLVRVGRSDRVNNFGFGLNLFFGFIVGLDKLSRCLGHFLGVLSNNILKISFKMKKKIKTLIFQQAVVA